MAVFSSMIFFFLFQSVKDHKQLAKVMFFSVFTGICLGSIPGLIALYSHKATALCIMDLGDKNTSAQYLAFSFALFFYLYLYRLEIGLKKYYFYFSFLIMIFLILLTYNRTLLIAILIAIFSMSIITKQWKELKIFSVTIFTLVIIAFLSPYIRWEIKSVFHPASDPSFQGRYPVWMGAIRMWKDHPWLGAGPESFAQENIQKIYHLPVYAAHGHNLFFDILGQYGALGVLSLGFFFIFWITNVMKLYRYGDLPRESVALTVGAMIILLLGGITHPMWGGSCSIMLVLIMTLTFCFRPDGPVSSALPTYHPFPVPETGSIEK